jgi:phenylpyruvate tautomerase PptA (4-oxalocrotonate tautomerase family)
MGLTRCHLARIEIVKGRATVDKKQILEGVHAALVGSFEIPDDDRTQRLVEHDPSNFEIPPGAGERNTLIEITAFQVDPQPRSGASTRRSSGTWKHGVPASDISLVLNEPPMENWGIRLGSFVQLAATSATAKSSQLPELPSTRATHAQ